MRIATGMSLTRKGSGCMTPQHKQTGLLCSLRNQTNVIFPKVSLKEDTDLHGCIIDKTKLSSNSNVEENSYSVNSVHLHSNDNEWLAFWLFLVSSSYFLLKKNVNFFRGFGVKLAEEVSLSDRTISDASTENDTTATNDAFNCSEISEFSPRTPTNNSRTELCSKFSDLDKATYMHSLLSLEDEDTEWLSDSKECSSENLSTPVSYKCDSFTEVSDVDTLGFWDSLLSLEGEDSEWISDSKQEHEFVFSDDFPSSNYKGSWDIEVPLSVSTISSEDNVSTDIEELSANEPLFWPFEGELNWNSEEPWTSFCTSPRKSFVFESRSRIKVCEQKGGDEALCNVNYETSRLSRWSKSSAKIVPLDCEDEKVAPLVLSNNTFLYEDFDSNKDIPLGKEYFALDQELPIETLVGLKEFDGHEGLDWEFNNDVFMMDDSLQWFKHMSFLT